jgi:predicted NAD/FAD-binding protein
MKIAVVGSGISGLTAAYVLKRKHEVHVFEAGDYIGGHTHTVPVEVESGKYFIDTGFIVFNDWTYPNFIKLMNQIGVASQESSMSFSVKAESSGLEYNGTDLSGLFAQRRNLINPSFYKMIFDILRFNKEATALVGNPTADELTLGKFLVQNKYSAEFKNHYIVPMGAAIWSASTKQMEDFPLGYFIRFFKNHGMISVNERPVWRVVKGGSHSYIKPLVKSFEYQIRLNSSVKKVKRLEKGVSLSFLESGLLTEEVFDEVVFASHSDQTLAMIEAPLVKEKNVLSSFAYQANDTVLHTDTNVLPSYRRAWAAWNYWIPEKEKSNVAVTYNMNILQGLAAPEVFCVSLNMTDQIDPKKILGRFVYDHPVYTQTAVSAQNEWQNISGKDRLHFCGAYWGFGFHEDGVKSGLRVAASLGCDF